MTEQEVDRQMEVHAQQIQDILDYVNLNGPKDRSERFSVNGTCKICGWGLSVEMVNGKVYAKCSTFNCFEISDL